MSKVYCGKCGAEIILPEKAEFVMGKTIAENTSGNYILPTKKEGGNNNMNKATTIMELLSSIEDKDLKELLVKQLNKKEVFNVKTDRGYIMAKMTKIITSCALDGIGLRHTRALTQAYTRKVEKRGWTFSLNNLIREFKAMIKQTEQGENNIIIEFLDHAKVVQLQREILDKILKEEKKHSNIWRKEVVKNLKSILAQTKQESQKNIVYHLAVKFLTEAKKYKMPINTKWTTTTLDLYKLVGAYYTLQNLYKFNDIEGTPLLGTGSKTEAWNIIDFKARHELPPYRFFAWFLENYAEILFKWGGTYLYDYDKNKRK